MPQVLEKRPFDFGFAHIPSASVVVIVVAVPIFEGIPPSPLTARFAELYDALNKQEDVLSQKSDNLRQTRDMLLPKLISGAVDVSKLEAGKETVPA